MMSPPLWLGWEAVSLVAIAIGFFITLLLHMLSTSFGMSSLGAWAKGEYMQVAVSILLLLFAVGMRDAGGRVMGEVTAAVAHSAGNIELENAAKDASGQVIDDPFLIAKSYIIQGPIACERNIYQIALFFILLIDPVNSISFGVGNVEGVSTAFFTQGYSSLWHYAAHNITYLALFHYIQYSVLQFAQYTMLQIFLPIGLGLRIFAPTRGAGGLMIGFALGFGFVFPMTYLLVSAMAPSTGGACTDLFLQAQQSPLNKVQPCFNNLGARTAVQYAVEADTDRDKISQGIYNIFGQLYVQAFFYPMVVLIIVFSFVRQTGSLFGADLGEIGRGLIKII